MNMAHSESAPQFNDEDNDIIEPMPIHVTKTTLGSILKEHGVNKLPDLSETNIKSARQNPKT